MRSVKKRLICICKFRFPLIVVQCNKWNYYEDAHYRPGFHSVRGKTQEIESDGCCRSAALQGQRDKLMGRGGVQSRKLGGMCAVMKAASYSSLTKCNRSVSQGT